MAIADLRRRYDYGYWANAKVLAVVAQLTPDEYTRDVAGSYGSIRNTLVHTMSAEWGWLERSGGPPRGPMLKAEDFPTFEKLKHTWSSLEGGSRAFLATLTDADLDRVVEFTLPQTGKRAMRVSEMLEHGVNHSVHHRGQVALLLRMLGKTPGNFDLLFYDGENRSVSV